MTLLTHAPSPATSQHPTGDATQDPSAPVFRLLERLGIVAKTYVHEPHHTVAESRLAHHLMPGLHTKNLFVKDKASSLFLITAEAESPLDLKTMDKAIGAKGRLSFASPEQMMTHLGIVPGSVSPLALVNETQGAVRFVIERKLLAAEWINVHPLINTRTTALTPQDLLRVLEATGHTPLITDLPYRDG